MPNTRRFSPALVAALILTGMISHGSAARAQSTEAQLLFDHGVADMLARRFDAACPAIQRSYEIEPLPGVMFTLAECFAGAGKIATAMARYADFRVLLTGVTKERRATFEERDRLAITRSAELAPRVPDLTIQVVRPTRDEQVTLNGQVLDAGSYDVPRPVDPGRYDVVALAEGRKRWRRTVVIRAGQHARLSVPELTSRPEALAARAPVRRADEAGAPSATKTWAYASGGLGLTGVAAGLVSGGLAWTWKSKAASHCRGNVCDATGIAAVQNGRTAATVSNVGLGVGALGLAIAALLFSYGEPSSSGRAKRGATSVGPYVAFDCHPGRVFLSGEFQ